MKKRLFETEIRELVYGLVPGKKGNVLILKDHAVEQFCDIVQRAFNFGLGKGMAKLEKRLKDTKAGH